MTIYTSQIQDKLITQLQNHALAELDFTLYEAPKMPPTRLGDCASKVASLPNGQLVSASDDYTLKIWDIRSGTCVRTLSGHTWTIKGVASLPNGQVVSAGDLTLKIWDIRSGKCIRTLSGHTSMVKGVASLHNAQVLSVNIDQTLKI